MRLSIFISIIVLCSSITTVAQVVHSYAQLGIGDSVDLRRLELAVYSTEPARAASAGERFSIANNFRLYTLDTVLGIVHKHNLDPRYACIELDTFFIAGNAMPMSVCFDSTTARALRNELYYSYVLLKEAFYTNFSNDTILLLHFEICTGRIRRRSDNFAVLYSLKHRKVLHLGNTLFKSVCNSLRVWSGKLCILRMQEPISILQSTLTSDFSISENIKVYEIMRYIDEYSALVEGVDEEPHLPCEARLFEPYFIREQ